MKAVKPLPIKKVKEREIEKKSVLVVDDSITTRTLEKNILESSGYDVTLAVDGLDAYNKLQNKDFDIIVLDVQMPNMDGFAFTEKARNTQEFSNIPIILVTSLESDADKRRGIEVGADAYIVKRTFDQSNLLETIKRLI
jgi:two-component system chemotaxis sensor kinase CheA